MSFYFPTICNNWKATVEKPVKSTDGESHKKGSFKGRAICLVHTLATPLKVLSGFGKTIVRILDVVAKTLAVLTLNAHPKHLLSAAASVVDIPVGFILLCCAIASNILRGIIGTIVHPGVMIKDESSYDSCRDFNCFAANHNLLQGTIVNYPV